jgi:hypothetical protein
MLFHTTYRHPQAPQPPVAASEPNDIGHTTPNTAVFEWNHENILPPHVHIVGQWLTNESGVETLQLLPEPVESTAFMSVELHGEMTKPHLFPDSHAIAADADDPFEDESVPTLDIVYKCHVSGARALIRARY